MLQSLYFMQNEGKSSTDMLQVVFILRNFHSLYFTHMFIRTRHHIA